MQEEKTDGRQYGIKISPKLIIMACALFFGLLIIVGVLTRVLPQGAFEREIIDGQERIVNGTYALLEDQTKLPIWKWFTAPFEVLGTQTGMLVILISALSVCMGGLYYVLDKADILKRLISFIYKHFGKRKYLLLFVTAAVFLIGGSVGGLVDEVIGLLPLMILLSISMGWDSFVAVGICFLAVCRGYAASTLSPYGTALIQGLADVPLYSGLWMRFLYLILTGAALILFLYFYAKKIEKNPLKSVVYDTDEKWRREYTGQALFDYEKRKYPFGEIIKDFGKGALAMLPTAAITCLICGVQYLIQEGNILDTIIYRMALLTEGASSFGAAMIMLAFIMIVEIALPGTLIKALTIIPIVVPLGEFSGISRQTSCLIFLIGDSFPNLLYPTDAMLILALGIVGCTYKKWVKWLLPYIAVTLGISVLTIVLALSVGY